MKLALVHRKEDCVGNSVRPPDDYARKNTWQRGLDPSEVKLILHPWNSSLFSLFSNMVGQFSFAVPRSWGVPFGFLSFQDAGDSF